MSTAAAATELQRQVRIAARALARAGLAHAYGHCSARLDATSFIVCAPRPMGLIEPGEDGTVVGIDAPLPDGVLGEVRMHQAIYRRRADVGGVCRTQPPATVALSTVRLTPKARHGPSAYFAPAPPLWDNPGLVRDDETADAVAAMLGDAPAVVLRGNGAVTVGETLAEAVVLAWYLEDAARVETTVQVLAAGDGCPVELTEREARRRAVWDGGILDRMWDHLTAGDPER